ncbi:hypothetical protein HN51_004145, partial [Arachis hypogaea]
GGSIAITVGALATAVEASFAVVELLCRRGGQRERKTSQRVKENVTKLVTGNR